MPVSPVVNNIASKVLPNAIPSSNVTGTVNNLTNNAFQNTLNAINNINPLGTQSSLGSNVTGSVNNLVNKSVQNALNTINNINPTATQTTPVSGAVTGTGTAGNAIDGGNLQGASGNQTVTGANATESSNPFKTMLDDAIDAVNETQSQTEKDLSALAAGKTDDLHTIMINSAKADLALQMLVQVRNKAIDAYNEIMRINL